MNIHDARKFLNVSAGISKNSLKNTYKKLCAIHHPDKGGDCNTFNALTDAYRICLTHTSYDTEEAQLEDFQVINISLVDAFNGTVFITGTDIDPIPHTIPPGSINGEILSFEDGLWKIAIQSTDNFKINVNENPPTGTVYTSLKVSPFIMITGGWAEVETLDGNIRKIRIPAGLEANSSIKLLSHGYWINNKSNARGDLLISIIPDIKKLNEYDVSTLKKFCQLVNNEH